MLENKTYLVKLAPTEELVMKASGKVLMEKGFKVMIDKEYEGIIFEIELKKE